MAFSSSRKKINVFLWFFETKSPLVRPIRGSKLMVHYEVKNLTAYHCLFSRAILPFLLILMNDCSLGQWDISQFLGSVYPLDQSGSLHSQLNFTDQIKMHSITCISLIGELDKYCLFGIVKRLQVFLMFRTMGENLSNYYLSFKCVNGPQNRT